jgi:DNA modification methylase
MTNRQDGSDGLNSPRAGAGRMSEGRHNNHPTVKPIALMEWLVRLVTPANGLILDPFMGSGTTGIAATRNGFNFLGIEQDKDYIQIAKARIAA